MSTAQQVIAHIDGYMRKFPNTTNSQWYVGIASDLRQRLFNDHRVSEQQGVWAYIPADTSAIARSVETTYHNAGCDGGPGGGDNTTVVVYAYLKSGGTSP
jgi:hypothetical protein